MFIDTHAHYDDDAFDADRDELLLKVHKNGTEAIINAAQDYKTSLVCVELAEKYPFLYATVGVHPHEAANATDEELILIEKLAAHNKVVAIGEAGLDYHYNFSPVDDQKRIFAANIEISGRVGKPIVVHDREAHSDVLEMMAANIQPGGAVVHCFSGSAEMAKVIASKGWYFSVGGAATFKNARRIIEALAVIPDELLMLETDCPYMTPEPFRGKRNDSSYIEYTAKRIAEIKGMTYEELCAVTNANARRFFAI
ncbi:MAG: TatD family deoxyribonuclease [Ruminococcaceae bacterium]|nr:TatD family deoxyribonuclease [Oscillospiraceae bacterium]